MPTPGTKATSGLYQRIINQIPPHDIYIEPFLGCGTIMSRKRPAFLSVGVDTDYYTIDHWAGREIPGLRLYRCCGVEWLKHYFDLYQFHGVPPQRRYCTLDEHFPRIMVYCDPPYLRHTRLSKRRMYRHEMTASQHKELLDTLIRLPCYVMVSGYYSSLYDSYLKGWRSTSIQCSTRGNGTAHEYVWMNYPEPDQLHDYRYLGSNKRARERVRRRIRSWKSALLRLPELEQAALLEALNSAVFFDETTRNAIDHGHINTYGNSSKSTSDSHLKLT